MSQQQTANVDAELDAIVENLQTASRDGLPTARLESMWVQRNLDDAQYYRARGSEYEGPNLVTTEEHDRSLDEIRDAYERLPAEVSPTRAKCPGCLHPVPDPHQEQTSGFWCIADMNACIRAGEDPNQVGPCF